MSNCDYCLYYVYDEEFDEYICSAAGDMDEDDFVRHCPKAELSE